ncbi:hypothetical protein [Candidatus Laterigemmans baculatus]|uniref:hypothetical protein n=1 Tax=Candidatus Laterigemmans baculatus TaxID=2770505 RepID=UPI0013D9FF18|nr:hypothetical protein [Candidatus Laterigemmans baculatus]
MTARRSSRITNTPRKFIVEIREKGAPPKVVANQVSLAVARTICRELVRPSVYAVVRRVDQAPQERETPRTYSVWLWDTQQRIWNRATEPMEFQEAYHWVRSWERNPIACLALVWPGWAAEPPQLLDAVA